jgi:Ca2+-transporting ATPase
MQLEALEIGSAHLDPRSFKANPGDIFADAGTLALAAGVLNSDVDVHHNAGAREIFGSSTERALIVAAQAAGLSRTQLRQAYPRRLLRERTSESRYVISVHGAPDGGSVAFVKGAPEQVLRLCTHHFAGALDAAARRRILNRSAAMAAEGLRVLALGWKRLRATDGSAADRGYTLIALAGLRDPVRDGAADAVRTARQAGIKTVILTGDHRRTADAIARAVGLEGKTVDGPDVMRRLRAGRSDILDQVAVISRVTPGDKRAIVRALRDRGEIVAMAGDGINDAPALKAADVGIAVGVAASDLTRHAADVVLASEDLRSILAAVGEGRIVQDNLRRAIHYLAATNGTEVLLVLGAALAGAAAPLTPLQLLWVNLLTDTLPALALALEPGHPEVLDRPPAAPGAPLIGAADAQRILRDAGVLGGICLGALAVGGPPLAFSVLTAGQLGYTTLCRSPERAAHPRFARMMGLASGLQLAAISLPPLRAVLGLHGAVTTSEVIGFWAGLLLPWAFAPRDLVIVRHGRTVPSADEYQLGRRPAPRALRVA